MSIYTQGSSVVLVNGVVQISGDCCCAVGDTIRIARVCAHMSTASFGHVGAANQSFYDSRAVDEVVVVEAVGGGGGSRVGVVGNTPIGGGGSYVQHPVVLTSKGFTNIAVGRGGPGELTPLPTTTYVTGGGARGASGKSFGGGQSTVKASVTGGTIVNAGGGGGSGSKEYSTSHGISSIGGDGTGVNGGTAFEGTFNEDANNAVVGIPGSAGVVGGSVGAINVGGLGKNSAIAGEAVVGTGGGGGGGGGFYGGGGGGGSEILIVGAENAVGGGGGGGSSKGSWSASAQKGISHYGFTSAFGDGGIGGASGKDGGVKVTFRTCYFNNCGHGVGDDRYVEPDLTNLFLAIPEAVFNTLKATCDAWSTSHNHPQPPMSTCGGVAGGYIAFEYEGLPYSVPVAEPLPLTKPCYKMLTEAAVGSVLNSAMYVSEDDWCSNAYTGLPSIQCQQAIYFCEMSRHLSGLPPYSDWACDASKEWSLTSPAGCKYWTLGRCDRNTTFTGKWNVQRNNIVLGCLFCVAPPMVERICWLLVGSAGPTPQCNGPVPPPSVGSWLPRRITMNAGPSTTGSWVAALVPLVGGCTDWDSEKPTTFYSWYGEGYDPPITDSRGSYYYVWEWYTGGWNCGQTISVTASGWEGCQLEMCSPLPDGCGATQLCHDPEFPPPFGCPDYYACVPSAESPPTGVYVVESVPHPGAICVSGCFNPQIDGYKCTDNNPNVFSQACINSNINGLSFGCTEGFGDCHGGCGDPIGPCASPKYWTNVNLGFGAVEGPEQEWEVCLVITRENETPILTVIDPANPNGCGWAWVDSVFGIVTIDWCRFIGQGTYEFVAQQINATLGGCVNAVGYGNYWFGMQRATINSMTNELGEGSRKCNHLAGSGGDAVTLLSMTATEAVFGAKRTLWWTATTSVSVTSIQRMIWYDGPNGECLTACCCTGSEWAGCSATFMSSVSAFEEQGGPMDASVFVQDILVSEGCSQACPPVSWQGMSGPTIS